MPDGDTALDGAEVVQTMDSDQVWTAHVLGNHDVHLEALTDAADDETVGPSVLKDRLRRGDVYIRNRGADAMTDVYDVLDLLFDQRPRTPTDAVERGAGDD